MLAKGFDPTTTRERPDSAASSYQGQTIMSQLSESPSNAKRKDGKESSVSCMEQSTKEYQPVNLEDSFRGLYFAPMAMVVLDQNRNIVVLNELAKDVLGIPGSAACTGRPWEDYLPLSSRSVALVALNEAAEKFSKSTTARLSSPNTTRIEINNVLVDLTISAWSQNVVIFDPAPEEETSNSARIAQESFFTISLQPCRNASEQETFNTKENVKNEEYDLIKEFSMDSLELPLMAFSRQGKIVNRNKASDEIWSNLRDPKDKDSALGKGDMESEGEFDISWVHDIARMTDENFVNDLPESSWPIYKCAIMGLESDPVIMGIESKLNGSRVLLEVIGYPIRANGGKGEHVGGVLSFRNVTEERKRIKLQAEEQGEGFFKQTCDTIPLLVFVTDAIGRSEYYSKAWYEYTGASHDVADTEAWGKYWHSDDLLPALDQWKQAIKDEAIWESVFRVLRHDNTWRWFQGRAVPIKDDDGRVFKWYGTCTDVNDHLEALSASRRAQSQLESVIKHANVTLWAVNRDGIVIIAKGSGVGQDKVVNSTENPKGTTIQKITIGESIYNFYSTSIQKAVRQALDGETTVEETKIDGRWFRTSYTPMRAQPDEMPSLVSGGHSSDNGEDINMNKGEVTGVVGASMDITDRKAAQAEMEKSLVEKSNALAAEGAAREASRLKSEFLANMSHEIRTPIAGVIGLSELILDETNLTKQLREYVETIQRSAEGLLHVINDVLDFSKVEVGKLIVEQAPFDLNTLIVDAKRMMTFATEKKNLDFKWSLELGYKGLLIGDAGRLKQVIINLLSNAIKFTSRGYISLEVTEILEDKDNIQIRFDIRDTGSGINTKALAGLFQPFSQADPSTARRFGGTGLGLSISKNLVELMNGKIGLNSVEGQGSHAWFTVPFVKSKAVEKDMIEELPSTLIERPREDIWILIAEDNEVNARIALKNVEKMGFRCQIAKDGLIALQELNNRKYDLVLMDCHMPECDGYEATRLLRKSANLINRALPVIALTASAITGDREKALEAGMVDYLSKPVSRAALEKTLCKWLFDHQARQALDKYSPQSFKNDERVPLQKTTELSQWSIQLSSFKNVKDNHLESILNHRFGSRKVSWLADRRFSDERYNQDSLDRPSLASRSQSYGAAPLSSSSSLVPSGIVAEAPSGSD